MAPLQGLFGGGAESPGSSQDDAAINEDDEAMSEEDVNMLERFLSGAL